MNENLTRREVLFGMAAAPFLQGATGSSICFMSALEMARLIRAKKLSAREALAAHLKQIERRESQGQRDRDAGVGNGDHGSGEGR